LSVFRTRRTAGNFDFIVSNPEDNFLNSGSPKHVTSNTTTRKTRFCASLSTPYTMSYHAIDHFTLPGIETTSVGFQGPATGIKTTSVDFPRTSDRYRNHER
jgi:hypothetical protein